MTEQEREMARRWVQAWKDAAPVLEAVRREDIRRADPVEALAQLECAFNHAVRSQPPRATSGMVEMQRLFAKLRK
ncbi:MAG: hypothetical protein HY820_26540 [Acidobacteria bacterium]|nr:hypothetical protein [Acidobacteriota bacterium]